MSIRDRTWAQPGWKIHAVWKEWWDESWQTCNTCCIFSMPVATLVRQTTCSLSKITDRSLRYTWSCYSCIYQFATLIQSWYTSVVCHGDLIKQRRHGHRKPHSFRETTRFEMTCYRWLLSVNWRYKSRCTIMRVEEVDCRQLRFQRSEVEL